MHSPTPLSSSLSAPCLVPYSAAAKAQPGSPWMQKAYSFMTVSVAGVCPSGEAWAPHCLWVPTICRHVALSLLSSQQPIPVSLCFPSD